jgi:GT2 family glycosyltransferase
MLNISVVIYGHSYESIAKLIAYSSGSKQISTVFIIDNYPIQNKEWEKLSVEYIFTGKNVGYGAGHNIAIRKTIAQKTPYHLVLNPDVEFDGKILDKLIEFLEENKNVGLVMPKVFYPNGELQYLCKLLPTPFNLFFRRFLPSSWTKRSNEKFELRSSGYNQVMDVPYLSGCFMLLRTSVLEEIGLFDERFFMYPEDIDLTRRIHQKYRTVFYPHVSIVHHHEKGSYKNGKLLFTHLWNIILYFNKWGWLFDRDRKKINKKTLQKLNLL